MSHRAEVTAISGDANLIAVFFQAARQSLRFRVSVAVTQVLGSAGNVDKARESRDTLRESRGGMWYVDIERKRERERQSEIAFGGVAKAGCG